jgi:hypothetical protein
MGAAKVYDALSEITRLEGELAATRRAPSSHDERLAVAKAQFARAGEQSAPSRSGSRRGAQPRSPAL